MSCPGVLRPGSGRAGDFHPGCSEGQTPQGRPVLGAQEILGGKGGGRAGRRRVAARQGPLTCPRGCRATHRPLLTGSPASCPLTWPGGQAGVRAPQPQALGQRFSGKAARWSARGRAGRRPSSRNARVCRRQGGRGGSGPEDVSVPKVFFLKPGEEGLARRRRVRLQESPPWPPGVPPSTQ